MQEKNQAMANQMTSSFWQNIVILNSIGYPKTPRFTRSLKIPAYVVITRTIVLFSIFGCFLFSCTSKDIVDSNISIEDNDWAYAKTAKSTIEITDTVKTYNVYFKLRHTADYRYSNLYAIFRLKGNGLNSKTRYQFKVAQADGQWLGKGSGDLYSHQFTLLSKFRFPKVGKYELEIEQNMRDNPLTGISDIGLKVEKND